MSSNSVETSHQQRLRSLWLQRARKLKRLTNIAWVIDLSLWPTLLSASIAAAILLALRKYFSVTLVFWLILLVVLATIVFICYLFARRRFISVQTALAELDNFYGFHCKLLAALEGKAAWPELPESDQEPYTLAFLRSYSPLLFSIVLVLAAARVPISPPPAIATSEAAKIELPVALAEVEAWTEKLAESGAISEDSLENLKQELDNFKSEAPESWYDHPSLEAADTLKENTSQQIDALLGSLEQLEQAVKQLERLDLSQSEKALLEKQLSESVESLKGNPLSLNEQLMSELDQFRKAPSNAQSKALQETLKNHLDKLQRDLARSGKGQASGSQEQKGEGSSPQHQRSPTTSPGSKPAGNCDGNPLAEGGMCTMGEEKQISKSSGAPTRGKADAPLELTEKPPQLTSNRLEAIPDQGVGKEPGETLGITARAPDEPAPSRSHELAAPFVENSEAAEAAWKSEFTPEEREALRRYFK